MVDDVTGYDGKTEDADGVAGYDGTTEDADDVTGSDGRLTVQDDCRIDLVTGLDKGADEVSKSNKVTRLDG